jgi:hypothetical protein
LIGKACRDVAVVMARLRRQAYSRWMRLALETLVSRFE